MFLKSGRGGGGGEERWEKKRKKKNKHKEVICSIVSLLDNGANSVSFSRAKFLVWFGFMVQAMTGACVIPLQLMQTRNP